MIIIASLIAALGLFALKFRARPALILEVLADTESPIGPATGVPLLHSQPSFPGARDQRDEATEPQPVRIPALPRRVSMPVVFQPFDRQFWNLNDAQLAVVEQLRTKFVNDIGGTDQDPNDPA